VRRRGLPPPRRVRQWYGGAPCARHGLRNGFPHHELHKADAAHILIRHWQDRFQKRSLL
jgi:hypothetical protein